MAIPVILRSLPVVVPENPGDCHGLRPRNDVFSFLNPGHNNFIMVTIENEAGMCYNVMDYTPGGVYVE